MLLQTDTAAAPLFDKWKTIAWRRSRAHLSMKGRRYGRNMVSRMQRAQIHVLQGLWRPRVCLQGSREVELPRLLGWKGRLPSMQRPRQDLALVGAGCPGSAPLRPNYSSGPPASAARADTSSSHSLNDSRVRELSGAIVTLNPAA